MDKIVVKDAREYSIKILITDRKEMLALSEKWKPNRSTACWYLWRSLENKKD